MLNKCVFVLELNLLSQLTMACASVSSCRDRSRSRGKDLSDDCCIIMEAEADESQCRPEDLPGYDPLVERIIEHHAMNMVTRSVGLGNAREIADKACELRQRLCAGLSEQQRNDTRQ